MQPLASTNAMASGFCLLWLVGQEMETVYELAVAFEGGSLLFGKKDVVMIFLIVIAIISSSSLLVMNPFF